MVTWNLNNIYDFSKTEELLDELRKDTEAFVTIRKKLDVLTPEEFLNILKSKEHTAEISSKLSAYAELWLSENTADPKRNAHVAKLSENLTDLENQTLFFSLWFKSLDDKKAKVFIDYCKEYKHMLVRIREFKPHTLLEKEEQIINIKDLSGGDLIVRLYDIITNQFTFEWEGKTVQQPELTKYFTDKDPKKREKAYTQVMARYKQEEAVLTEIYKGIVSDWRNENLKLRNYATPIQVRDKSNDIPSEAITALLNVVQRNKSLFHDFFKVKAKVLGVDKLRRFDLYAPYPLPEKTYDFETSKRLVLDTYKAFSEDAYAHANKVFEEQHVHSDLIDNKRSGAFCYSITPSMTPFVLLNHTDKLRDVSTMAHELGHAMHSMFAKDQSIYSFHAELPLAETASVFGEQLLSKQLLKNANDEEKKALLMKKMDETYATIMRQAYFILFEKKAHDMIEQGATVDDLNAAYRENLNEQFEDSIIISDDFNHEWKYIPHIFHSPFYCYAYSFGNLLVLALYKMYKEQGKEFVPKYIKILSSGSSKRPQEILADVGVDITKESFWQQGFDVLAQDLELLKKLVKP